jgi:Bacterial Ig domain
MRLSGSKCVGRLGALHGRFCRSFSAPTFVRHHLPVGLGGKLDEFVDERVNCYDLTSDRQEYGWGVTRGMNHITTLLSEWRSHISVEQICRLMSLMAALALAQAVDAITISRENALLEVDPRGAATTVAIADASVSSFALGAKYQGTRSLWIATRSGVEFRSATNTLRFPLSAASASPSFLLALPDSRDAYLLQEDSLTRLSESTGESTYISRLPVSTAKIIGAAVDLNGALWVLTKESIYRISKDDTAEAPLVGTSAHAMAVDLVSGVIWVATDSGLLLAHLAHGGANAREPTNSSVLLNGEATIRRVTSQPTQSVAVDPDSGRVWALSDAKLSMALPNTTRVTDVALPLKWQEMSGVFQADATRIEYDRDQQILWTIAPSSLRGFACCTAQNAPIINVALSGLALSGTPPPYAPRPLAGLVGLGDSQTVSSPLTNLQIQLTSVCDGESEPSCDLSQRYRNDLLLEVVLNGEQIGGEFQIDPSSGLATFSGLRHLPVGQSFLTYRARDAIGRSSPMRQVRLTVIGDIRKANAVPLVNLVAPTASQVFTAPATITLSATASDADGTIAKLEFFRGTTTLVGTGALAAGKYNYSWANVAAGSYSLTARATDNLGATKTSSAVNIVVNAPPTVTINAPLNNSTFNVAESIGLQATAADSDGTISKVEFFRGGSTLIGQGTLTAGKYSYIWTGANAGTYSVTAKANDDRGGITTSAASIVTVCSATVVVTSPAANQVLNLPSPTVTSVSTAITATANYPAACGTVGKVDFYSGTTLLGTGVLAGGVYSFQWSSITAGSYSVKARAYRNATRSFTESTAVTFVVNKPPMVALESPAASVTFSAPANIALSATATDADGTISAVEFLQGSTVIATGALAGGKYTATWTNVGPGTYAISARAKDNRNAFTLSSPANSVTVGSACSPPAVAWSAPIAGAVINTANYYETTASMTLNATATATAGCGGVGRVEFYSGATLLGTAAGAGSLYSFAWSNVAAGTYTLKARAYLGATTSFSESATVNVIVNRPPAPNLLPIAQDTPFAPATIPLSATAVDADGTISKVEFLQNGQLIGLGSLSGSGYIATWSNVAQGSYAITARATDNRGATMLSSPVNLSVQAPLLNLALGKPTRQSSTASGAPRQRMRTFLGGKLISARAIRLANLRLRHRLAVV